MEKKKALIEKLSSIDENMDIEEASTLVRDLMKEWNSIGHVPFKEKDKLYKQYHGLIDQLFDLRPKAIEERLKLRNPIYQETAAYGHMGREPQVVTKKFSSRYEGDKTVEVELFTWEKLDYVDKIKAAFGL